jgi:hypothetical protein
VPWDGMGTMTLKEILNDLKEWLGQLVSHLVRDNFVEHQILKELRIIMSLFMQHLYCYPKNIPSLVVSFFLFEMILLLPV